MPRLCPASGPPYPEILYSGQVIPVSPHKLGHAAAVFKNKLWVTGGRGELYQTYNLRYQNRRGDVWSSSDGTSWLKSDELTGDFHLQNFDAVDPGSLAPWYARFGHTLDVLNATDYSGELKELMILVGGYTPDPDNDVWVTEDGSESVKYLNMNAARGIEVLTAYV